MVVYGVECGMKDVPGVYANIPEARTWIDKQMEAENLDKPYVI